MIYIYLGVGLLSAYSVISTGKAGPMKGVVIGAAWPLLVGFLLLGGLVMFGRHLFTSRATS